MRAFYVQILCKSSQGEFIECGILDDHGEYLIYRDLDSGLIEGYKSLKEFKSSMVYSLKDFRKYCKVVELK